METARWVGEPEKMLPVRGEYDVVAVDVGIAGVAAALAAASGKPMAEPSPEEIRRRSGYRKKNRT